MDKRTEELVAFKRNKVITPLQTEELNIRLKLVENIDKQATEQARVQDKDLEKAAIAGDSLSRAKFENSVVGGKEEEMRRGVRKDIDSKTSAENKRLDKEQGVSVSASTSASLNANEAKVAKESVSVSASNSESVSVSASNSEAVKKV